MTDRYLARLLLATACLGGAACSSWKPPAQSLPVRNTMKLDQLIIYSDAPLPKHHRLLDDITEQRAALTTVLGLPHSDEPIHVYLFAGADRFKSFMQSKYPDFPDRRAFFVETDTRLSVYAYWGDRVAEDLRHEVAHGYLHSVVPRLPLWLDEGLAEYFEVPRGEHGLNRPHVKTLQGTSSDTWRPDLRRLESLRSAGDMTQADYAESWAWVHFMLETTRERRQFLQRYLQSLRKGTTLDALSIQLNHAEPDCESKLVEYVTALNEQLK